MSTRSGQTFAVRHMFWVRSQVACELNILIEDNKEDVIEFYDEAISFTAHDKRLTDRVCEEYIAIITEALWRRSGIGGKDNEYWQRRVRSYDRKDPEEAGREFLFVLLAHLFLEHHGVLASLTHKNGLVRFLANRELNQQKWTGYKYRLAMEADIVEDMKRELRLYHHNAKAK